jgi:hypothetical protein
MGHRGGYCEVTSWLDDVSDKSLEENTTDFYCPYTNSEKCALLIKGWQPQELCLALECEQMQLVKHNRSMRRRNKAA